MRGNSCDPNGTGEVGHMGGKMFNNLIESSSHAREFKRRGAFVLFTAVTYGVLFVITGVMTIYAYDAHLDDQNTQIITMLNPVELDAIKPTPTIHNAAPLRGNNSKQNYVEREIRMANVNRPDVAPEKTSAKPNTNLPIPDSGAYKITGRDFDPGVLGGPGNSKNGGGNELNGSRTPVIDVGPPPAVPQVERIKARIIHKSVINGEALSLPKPPYPPLARQMRIQGSVSVQVLIDESGRVVSAKAVSGNPALVSAAQRAAFEARFSPTLLDAQPMKVSGVITYNFVLQ
ncbi:MAG: energy transducer TonB [Acidobacteriota bacterium]|nr:energy transducer TonB [Acidobacteriota bacterium]